MIGPNVPRQCTKGTYTYIQHYCIMYDFVVCYNMPFSSVVVCQPWYTRGFTVDCSWCLVILPLKRVGADKFQIRMEVKLRNHMFSIRPASTICVLVLGRAPVIQDSVGSVVDV